MSSSVVAKEIAIQGKEYCLSVLETALRSRLLDEKMNKLVRQNKGGTFFLSNAGHELIGAISALNMQPGKDWALPYYRDRTFAIGYGTTSKEILVTAMAKEGDHHSGGRMMPEHFSDRQKRIVCQSSIVGSQYLHAVGIAKSIAMKGKDEVVYVSGGDGSTSQGDFHEALNFASIHQLPVIFVVQNNGWAISVSVDEQTAGGDITKCISSIPGLRVETIDGCDFKETTKTMKEVIAHAREGKGPVVVNAILPRLGAHSNSDDPKRYLSESSLTEIHQKDPIPKYINWLIEMGVFSEEEIDDIRSRLFNEIEEASKEAEQVPAQPVELATEHVFKHSPLPHLRKIFAKEQQEVVIVDAINHALDEEMTRDDSVVVFGQDVAHGKGGVFGVTKGLTDKYGDRCFNTPLAESTIVGIAAGMSMAYHRPVAEIQFADYAWTAMNQLINELASIHYRSNGEWNCPLVIRMPCGGYIQGGPYHSQNIEAYLAHTPGLKVIYPSNAEDAKRLMKASIHDANPVVFLEHKGIYRQRAFSARKEPMDHELTLIGKANVIREGHDLTVIGYGMMAVQLNDVATQLSKEGISIEVIDMRTIAPIDKETIIESVKKTGKLCIVHEAAKTCGFGAEIAASIAEEVFEYLDAPIKRIAGKDCPVPYNKELENAVLPQKQDLINQIRQLASF